MTTLEMFMKNEATCESCSDFVFVEGLDRNIDEKYEVLQLSNCLILFQTITMHFGYSLHTLQEDYVLEVENILNINC